jgi:hypothetical protein
MGSFTPQRRQLPRGSRDCPDWRTAPGSARRIVPARLPDARPARGSRRATAGRGYFARLLQHRVVVAAVIIALSGIGVQALGSNDGPSTAPTRHSAPTAASSASAGPEGITPSAGPSGTTGSAGPLGETGSGGPGVRPAR